METSGNMTIRKMMKAIFVVNTWQEYQYLMFDLRRYRRKNVL